MNSETNSDKSKEVKCPPYPSELFDWTEKDRQHLMYPHEDRSDLIDRMKFKLFGAWMIWVDLIQNEKFSDIVSAEDVDKDSDEYYIRNIMVNMIDRLGKLLSNTDIISELKYTADAVEPKEDERND